MENQLYKEGLIRILETYDNEDCPHEEYFRSILNEAILREEKAKKFDEIQTALWNAAINGNMAISTLTASLIRELEIEGSNGEDPESA